MNPLFVRLAGASVSGLVAASAFEPYGLAYLLPIAVAGLTLTVHGCRSRRAFGLGLVFGLAFMLVLLPWMRIIGPDAWVGLSLLQALFYGLGGVATAAVTRLRWWPLWVAAVWVGVESLRGAVPFGGFPWGRLAFATIDTPLAASAAYVGASGTSFLVALVGAALAWSALHVRRVPLRAAAAVVGAAAVAAGPAALSLDPAVADDRGAGPVVAAVQGDVPGEGMNPFSERRAVLDNHVEATIDFAARVDAGEQPRPDLVIWPENSTDIDPFADASVRADIQAAVDAVGVPVLVGAMVGGEEPQDVYNQGIVWEPGSGPGEAYSKRHPVPFGEYIPFRDQLAPFFSRLDQIPRDMVPGDEPGVLTLGETTVGDVICFEVAYDDVVRDAARDTDLLVVQTNNATYMGTGQVEQQFAISRLRAIETGLPVVVAATNGVTGIIGVDGAVVSQAEVRTRSVLVEQLAAPVGTTWGLRLGLPVQYLLVGASVVATALGLGLGYRRRSRTGDRPVAVARTGRG